MMPTPIAAERPALTPSQLALLARPRRDPSALSELERRVADQLGVVRVVALGRYSGAMEVALRALEVGEGARVVLPEWTATAALRALSAVHARAIAAPCDVDRCSLTAKTLAPALKGADAVVVRHAFGQPAQAARIAESTAAAGVPLIEDGGLSYGASPIGRSGGVAVFDLGPAAALTALGGGLVATRDPMIASRLDELVGALPTDSWDTARAARQLVLRPLGGLVSRPEAGGRVSRMSPEQAAVALAGLDRVSDVVQARSDAARDLHDGLSGLPGLRLQRPDRHATNAWAGYVIRHAADPREVARRLLRRGVATRRPGLISVSGKRSWSEGAVVLPNHQGVGVSGRHRIIRVVRELVLELAGL